MSNGNVYVVKMALDEAARYLNRDELLKIPGDLTGKDDFYVNPLQVCAVYPARES
jgi:hypothetical protein